jgi:hypothetical protein
MRKATAATALKLCIDHDAPFVSEHLSGPSTLNDSSCQYPSRRENALSDAPCYRRPVRIDSTTQAQYSVCMHVAQGR